MEKETKISLALVCEASHIERKDEFLHFFAERDLSELFQITIYGLTVSIPKIQCEPMENLTPDIQTGKIKAVLSLVDLSKLFDHEKGLCPFIISEDLRIGVLTNSTEKNEKINAANVDKAIENFENILKRNFARSTPKVAIISEESMFLPSLIETRLLRGHSVWGPYKAKDFFASEDSLRFDGVFCLYAKDAEQAFQNKTIQYKFGFYPEDPVIHITPGYSDFSPQNLLYALYAVADVYRNTKEYVRLTKDPLPVTKIDDHDRE